MLHESPLITSIACLVLQPSLRSLLILDASFTALEQVAQQMLEIANAAGQTLRPVLLRSAEDDDLWGERILPGATDELETHLQIFSPPHDTNETLLLIIPDLSALSLAAARASIMLMGATVAHLERHGQQSVWSPHYYWLASCRTEEIGAVSPHLLDRFALRLSWHSAKNHSLSHQERLQILQNHLQADYLENTPFLRLEERQSVAQATHARSLVEISDAACDQLLAYFGDTTHHQRRELALARCSLALAQLAGETQLQATHITEAAELMGLQKTEPTQTPEPLPDAQEQIQPGESSDKHRSSPSTTKPQTPSLPPPPEVASHPIDVHVPEQSELQPLEYIATAPDPYPEDTQPILREPGFLKLPYRHFTGLRSDRGPIIGIEPSTTLRDLAIVSTLMRALLFQAFRPKQPGTKIVLDWTDLRKYRRAALPERHLLLLLDYTCLPLAQRQHALVPYLSQAYRERAGITIIKVGSASNGPHTKSALRAYSISARNILVPAISEAIDIASGSATPLAHGMELALQIMQRVLQHGRSTVQHMTFVVLSDGRGNVPLKASHKNILTLPITREGFEDALKVAQEIGQVRSVSSIVLSPTLRYYKDLPQRLANALNAQFISLTEEEGKV
jgi:magnesium chelatase subunit D